MSLVAPATKEELIQNCLCRLGHPVIEVNVAPEQCEILVEQAIEKWQDTHFDGNIPVYYVHDITPADEATNSITLPDAIHGVTKIVPVSSSDVAAMSGSGTVSSAYDIQMYNTVSDILYGSSGSRGLITSGLNYYYSFMTYISTLAYTLVPTISFQFNRKTNIVYFNDKLSKIKTRYPKLVFEGFKKIDPQEFPEVWNDEWLKEYCTALIKRQWGENLKKFANLPLPGGATLNGEAIYNEAVTEIERLETRLYKEFQLPPQFMVG